MKNRIYIYTNTPVENFIKSLLFEFDVLILNDEFLTANNFINNNVLFIISEDIKNNISQSFFLNNNVMVFFSKKEKNLDKAKYGESGFCYGPIKVKQFIDTIKNYFFSKTIVFQDIKVLDEKITNIKNNSSCMLTSLEVIILTEFVQRKQMKREYFLEKILKINKDIETKTIESHLTRIRKKLAKIKSEIKISSKEDVFYINN